MTAREYLEGRADEIIKLTANIVYKRVLPFLNTLPPYIRHDITLDPEDMIAESVEHIIECADSFDCSKEKAFGGWVSRVAYNYCVSRMIFKRSTKRHTPPQKSFASLDKRITNHGESSEATLGDMLSDGRDFVEEMADAETARRVAAEINKIPRDRDRGIVWACVGGKTLEAAGSRYGVGRERVRQIKSSCLREVKHVIEMEDLL